MVITKNLKQKYALISVFDKKNLRYLCTNLNKYNYKFVSTGSTGNKIRDMGFKCRDISKITKHKEMFDGRVKTINPLIYSSLLYKRENEFHKKLVEKMDWSDLSFGPNPFPKPVVVVKATKKYQMEDNQRLSKGYWML